jgi:hypothetical protein
MAVRLSDLRAGRPLAPGRFLVLISVRGSVDSGAIVRLEGFGQFEKSNDLIGNRTRILPACSIVPRPTTLPRAPNVDVQFGKILVVALTARELISYEFNHAVAT